MMELHAIVPNIDEPKIVDICTFADSEDPKKYLTVVSSRHSILSGEFMISFDPHTTCMKDVISALSDGKFCEHLLQLGICGNAQPIELSDAEKEMIYDHKHDEIFDEEDDSEE